MGSSTENSAWGPSRNPWDPSRVPADRAAALPLQSRPGSRLGASAPTPAARSSSPRHCAGTSGCGRRTGPSRATGSSPSRRASTRSGRSRRPCATSRSSTRSSRAAIRSTRRRPSCPRPCSCRRAIRSAGVRLAVPQAGTTAWTRSSPASARRSSSALEHARGARRRGGGVRPPALVSLRDAVLLPRRPGRGVVEPRALRRRALRAARRGRDLRRDGRSDTRRGLRRRAEAPHHARHVRALRRATTTRSTGRRRRCARSSSASIARRSRASTRSSRRPRRRSHSRSATGPPIRSRCTPATCSRSRRASPGLPGLSIPCGLSEGLPVGLQLIGAAVRRERALPHRPCPRAGASGSTRSRSGCDDLGAGDRAGDPRPAEDADEDVLPLCRSGSGRGRTRRPARCASDSRARCR